MWLLSLKSVLVATDLGEISRAPLRTAARLAPLAGAGVHVLHVAEAHDADAEERLKEDFRAAAPDAQEPESLRVIMGVPAPAIVAEAIEVGADVIILGSHRKRPDEAVNGLGSTAASVVRNAPCPCLVAGTEMRLPLERVIVPVDVSDLASGALSVALSWASALRPRGGTVQLETLHVASGSGADRAGDHVHEQVELARRQAFGAAAVEITERVVDGAEPGEEILRVAASAPTDLLVMGSRGASKSTALGSVSAAVVRAAPCPILLVPPAAFERKVE